MKIKQQQKFIYQKFYYALFGFLTNIFYFESNQIIKEDFELTEIKLDILTSICFLILNPDNFNVLPDGLRVIANLCKNKKVVKHLFKLNY